MAGLNTDKEKMRLRYSYAAEAEAAAAKNRNLNAELEQKTVFPGKDEPVPDQSTADKYSGPVTNAVNMVGDALGHTGPFSPIAAGKRLYQTASNWMNGDAPDAPVDPIEPSTGGFMGGMVGGALNMPKEVVGTAAAGIDATANKIAGRPVSNMAATINETIPEYKPQGTIQEIGAVAGGIGAGTLAGGAGLEAMGVKALPKFFQWAAKILTPEVAGAVSVDPNSDGLFVGKEALVPVWGGMALDPEGRYDENLLKARLNLLADGLGTTGVLGTGIKTAHVGLKLVNDLILKPASVFLNYGKKEEAIVREMADTVNGFHVGESNEEQFARRQRLADLAQEGGLIQTKQLDDEGKVSNLAIKRDTMSAIDHALPNDSIENNSQKVLVNSLRSGQKGKGGSAELERVSAEPAKALENLNTQTGKVFGGDHTIQAAKDEVQMQAHNEVRQAKELVAGGEQRLTDNRAGAESLVKDDEAFGKQLPSDPNIKLDIGEKTRNIGEDITEKVATASDTMTKHKNDLFEAIPDTATVNVPSYEKARAAADHSMSQATRDNFDAAGHNFKQLNKTAGFELQSDIKSARAQGRYADANALEGLYRNITQEQPDYLIAHGDTDVINATQEARDYYRGEYAPKFREGALEDMQDIQRKKGTKPSEYYPESQAVIDNTIGDSKKARQTDKIVELLSSEEGGKNPKLLASYAKGKVAEKAQSILNAKGKLDPEDITSLTSEMEKYGTAFGNDKGDMEKFMTRLRDKNVDTKTLEKELETLKQNAKTVEQDVYMNRFGEFFSKGKEKGNGYAIFKKIMDGDEGVNEITNIRKMIDQSDNPDAKKGLQSAYAKWSGEKMFENSKTPGGSYKININTFKNDKEKMIQVGKEVFGENDPIVDAQSALWDEVANTTLSETQRAFRLGDVQDMNKGAHGAASTVITLLLGTLSRAGSRARAVVGRSITSLSVADQAKQIMDEMYADPQKFSEVLRRVADVDRNKMSKETYHSTISGIVKTLPWARKGEDDTLDETSKNDATDLGTIKTQTDEVVSKKKSHPSSKRIGTLKLNPQEQHLYEHHLYNLDNNKAVHNEDGSTSTVYQTSVDIKGKTYNFPTVWDGKILPTHEAVDRAIEEKGLDYWPSYNSVDEAESRYQSMHDVMEDDVD